MIAAAMFVAAVALLLLFSRRAIWREARDESDLPDLLCSKRERRRRGLDDRPARQQPDRKRHLTPRGYLTAAKAHA